MKIKLHIKIKFITMFFQIVPPTPAFENFIYHWEKFMVNYLEWTTDGKCSQTHVEQTNVPNHLEIVQQVNFTQTKFKNFRYFYELNIYQVIQLIFLKLFKLLQ